MLELEVVVHNSGQEARLADARVSNDDQLEGLVVILDRFVSDDLVGDRSQLFLNGIHLTFSLYNLTWFTSSLCCLKLKSFVFVFLISHTPTLLSLVGFKASVLVQPLLDCHGQCEMGYGES